MAKAKTQEVGRNVNVSVDGDKMCIEVDLSAKPEPSGSGKTMIIATTQGNKRVGDVHVGLNIYKYADAKKKGK
jgi:hypothetical protein